jgi:hypothetical protein
MIDKSYNVELKCFEVQLIDVEKCFCALKHANHNSSTPKSIGM